jgi:hypothetical protein
MTVISNYVLDRLCRSHLAFKKLCAQISAMETCPEDDLPALCKKALSEAHDQSLRHEDATTNAGQPLS